tara:strand:+ start:191 stop:358 length:168 start_codon:yes stop_codon:yes gene_type:complete
MWGRKKLGQNEKLLRNIKLYEQKEKARKQKSKILGQELVERKADKEKEINVHHKG